MPLGDLDGEQARGAADVAQRRVAREVELLRERLEVDARQPRHRAHELLELRQLGVERLEDALLSVLRLVLRLPGAQRFGQVVPVLEQPRVEHLEDAADIARAVAVEKQQPARRVEVDGGRPVAVAVEKAHRDQRIEEIRVGARMEAELGAQRRAGHPLRSETSEDAELDGGEKDLRTPESKGGGEDW